MVAAATIEGIETAEISQSTSFLCSNRDGLKNRTSLAVSGDGVLFLMLMATGDQRGAELAQSEQRSFNTQMGSGRRPREFVRC